MTSLFLKCILCMLIYLTQKLLNSQGINGINFNLNSLKTNIFFIKWNFLWVPEVRPSSGEGAPEKRSPGTAIPPGWQMQFTGGNTSEPPARHNRPQSPWTIRLPECVRPDWCLTGLSSAIACFSELGPRPTRRRVWVWISKYCQGVQQ